MTSFIRLILIVIIVGSVAPAYAQTVQIPASKDNTLYFSSSGSLSNGAGPAFFVGTTNGSQVRRGIIAFDVAGNIPAGATIVGATLTLRMSMTAVGTKTVELKKLLSDWGEGSSLASGGGGGAGGSAAVNDATWIHSFSPSTQWASPGGDFSQTSSASAVVGGNGFYTWGSTTQMVADVQDWLDNPTSNFGWILIGDETARSTKRFDSRESTNPSNRPVLTVEYQSSQNTVGAQAGLVSESVSAGNDVQFVVNISNSQGVDPSNIAIEWLAFKITIGGVDSDFFLISDTGIAALSQTADPTTAAFSFDHATGNTHTIATLSLASIGLSPGDTLTYLYAYTATDLSGLVLENIVVVTAE